MNISKKKQILNRMNYLKGHLEGVIKMIEEDKYCIDIIQQNQAVGEAIKKVNNLILASHLDTCVLDVVRSKKKSERKRVVKELLETFDASNRFK